MKRIPYKIRMTGLKVPAGTIPLRALSEVSEALLATAERAVRLAMEGTSKKAGRRPAWLDAATEFTFIGTSEGSTVIDFDAPQLGAVIPEKISQQHLFTDQPAENDTAVSVLLEAVSDAVGQDLESDRFDDGVLEGLEPLSSLLDKYADSVDIESSDRREENLSFDSEKLQTLKQIKTEIPEPAAVVLAGTLNVIEHREKAFTLLMKDNQQITGEVDANYVNPERMRDFWGEKVTVKGLAHFRPSGKIRFLELRLIRSFEPGDAVFEKEPSRASANQAVKETRRKTAPEESPLKKIWGQWPGEESIDEILLALENSHETSQ